MCGIVGYTGAHAAAPILLDGLSKLEYRGYDSAGIAVEGGGLIRMIKASGHIANLVEKTKNGAELPGTSLRVLLLACSPCRLPVPGSWPFYMVLHSS